MSFLNVSARLRVCSSRALSRLRALFRFVLERGVRTPALCLEFRFRVGVRYALCSVSLCECAVSSSFGCVSFCPHVFCGVAHSSCFYRLRAFMLCLLCFHVMSVMSCAVWHVACVFHELRAFMFSCLVWTRGLWVFSLAACLCPVLHMAGDLFCWPCACVFVLCEYMALS